MTQLLHNNCLSFRQLKCGESHMTYLARNTVNGGPHKQLHTLTPWLVCLRMKRSGHFASSKMHTLDCLTAPLSYSVSSSLPYTVVGEKSGIVFVSDQNFVESLSTVKVSECLCALRLEDASLGPDGHCP